MVEHYLNKQQNLNKREIVTWLEWHGVRNFIINEDLTVDVNGDVYLRNKDITRIPIQFGKVSNNFHCDGNLLKSLKGCPSEVGNFFNCRNNQLESLEFGPKKVGGSYDCSNNKLTDLKFSPNEIGNEFVVLTESSVVGYEYRKINNNFTNSKYNELNPKELLDYVQKEELSNKLHNKINAIRSASEAPFKAIIRKKI